MWNAIVFLFAHRIAIVVATRWPVKPPMANYLERIGLLIADNDGYSIVALSNVCADAARHARTKLSGRGSFKSEPGSM